MLFNSKRDFTEALTDCFTFESNEFEYRTNPLTGHASYISVERANRGFNPSAILTSEKKSTDCKLCDYRNATSGPVIFHKDGSVSISNKYPYQKFSLITLYPPFDGCHKILPSKLGFDDMERMINTEFDLAKLMYDKRNRGIVGMLDVTNWGPEAGATQKHPHSQRLSMSMLDRRIQTELKLCEKLKSELCKNPFEYYIEEERRVGSRIIHDGDVFICADFSPITDDSILIIPKDNITSVLEMDSEDYRNRIMRPVVGVLNALYCYRGVRSFNIHVHMSPFERDVSDYYRYHIHIEPRKSGMPCHIGSIELGNTESVVTVYPEDTASVLKKWYIEGPNQELIRDDIKEEIEKLESGS